MKTKKIILSFVVTFCMLTMVYSTNIKTDISKNFEITSTSVNTVNYTVNSIGQSATASFDEEDVSIKCWLFKRWLKNNYVK